MNTLLCTRVLRGFPCEGEPSRNVPPSQCPTLQQQSQARLGHSGPMFAIELSADELKQHRFIAAASSVVLIFWFVCCISLYWNSPLYQLQLGQLYESRWLLSSLGVSVFFTWLFLKCTSITLLTAVVVSAQYALVYSTISFFVYCIDSVGAVSAVRSGQRDQLVRYLRLTFTLIFLSVVAFVLSVLLLRRLVLLIWRCQPQCERVLHTRFVQVCSALHALFALFSIYVCSETASLKTTYVQSYMVQQICCALLALALALIQGVLYARPNSAVRAVLVILNVCQFAQELAHAWNAYYISIYVKSVSVHVREDLLSDQLLMSAALLVHGVRLLLCSLLVARLVGSAFGAEVRRKVMFTPHLTPLVPPSQIARAAHSDAFRSSSLLYSSCAIAVCYAMIDVGFFASGSGRRTLTASTGISLFYALFIALSFRVYIKRRIAIALKVAAMFSIVLLDSSLHTLYMFVQESAIGSMSVKVFHGRTSAFLHGADLFLAMCAGLLSVETLRFSTRTVLTHSVLRTQPATINQPLRILNHLASFNIVTAVIELILILIMKIGWKMNDSAVNFGVLDWICVLSTCVLQKWVCMHERYQCCLIILILQLLVECITTLSFLCAQTSYIQLMLSLSRSHNVHTVRQILPVDHIFVVLTDHAVQVVQWAVALCSMGVSLVVLENLAADPVVPSSPPAATITDRGYDDHFSSSDRVTLNDGGLENALFDDDSLHIERTSCEPSSPF